MGSDVSDQRRAVSPDRAGTEESEPEHRRSAVVSLLLLVLAATIVAGFFAILYDDPDATAYTGSDTPWYVWRANLVAADGIGALPEAEPPPFRSQAHRAAHPLLAAFLLTIGIGPEELAYALPALAAALTALAAAAFALEVLREPRWSLPVYAVAVGASLNVTLIASGRPDAVLVTAVVTAAAVPALTATAGRGGAVAASLLLGTAAAVHWPFALLFAGVLAAVALLLLPGSIRAVRQGGRSRATPAARLGMVLAGGGAVGAGALALAPAPPVVPRGSGALLRLLDDFGPTYARLAPVPAVGALALGVPADPVRRRGLLLALVWAGTAIAAAAAVAVGLEVPAHRVVPFALGIPLLGGAAFAGAGRMLVRLRPRALGVIAAAVVVVAALAGSMALARTGWRIWPPQRGMELAQARAAAAYLEAVGGDAPVVFVVDLPGRLRLIDTIRSVLSPRDILRARAYIGTVENLLARRPTLRDDVKDPELYRANSLNHWEAVRPVLDDDPTVLSLSAFQRGRDRGDPIGTTIAEGVTVVRGPVPDDLPAIAVRPLPVPSPLDILATALAALALLATVGIGWAWSLVPATATMRVALAPALGLAALVVAGLAAGRLGLDGGRTWGWIALGAAALGWAPVGIAAWKQRARRDSDGGVC